MTELIKVLCTACQTELMTRSDGPGAILECPKCHIADTRENVCAELLNNLQREVDRYFGMPVSGTKDGPRYQLVQN